jgi:hypothetical protein
MRLFPRRRIPKYPEISTNVLTATIVIASSHILKKEEMGLTLTSEEVGK